MDNIDYRNSKLSVDRRSLLQDVNSETVMDPPDLYKPNDQRQPQNIQLQPLFKQRQFSQTASFNHGNIIQAPLSPSKSVDFSSIPPRDQIIAEKQYHFLPGDESELNRSSTLPKSLSRDVIEHPPYPIPQPHPRNFSPMDRNNIITPNSTLGIGNAFLPFNNSPKQGFIRDPFEKRGQQTFSTFLEDTHYETLEKRGQQDTAGSSVISFPPSKPTMTDVKNMKIDEDDTIVRQITVTKKNRNYTTNWLNVLFQLFLIVLILGVAAVAIIALLEVKRLEGTTTPTEQTTIDLAEIENQITNLTSTISGLKAQITSLTQQLTSTNATLGARVITVEDERTQLNIQIQNLNSSLLETGNSSIGPCIHSRRRCRASTGNVCIPNGNDERLQVKEGYRVTGVWCEGILDDETRSLQFLSKMSTYVVFFSNQTIPAYECGCRLDETEAFIYGCETNIVQCKV